MLLGFGWTVALVPKKQRLENNDARKAWWWMRLRPMLAQQNSRASPWRANQISPLYSINSYHSSYLAFHSIMEWQISWALDQTFTALKHIKDVISETATQTTQKNDQVWIQKSQKISRYRLEHSGWEYNQIDHAAIWHHISITSTWVSKIGNEGI